MGTVVPDRDVEVGGDSSRARPEPWVRRLDWATGRIESSHRLVARWIIALGWNLPLALVSFALWRGLTDGGRKPLLVAIREQPPVLALLLFMVVGVALLYPAVRDTVRVISSGRAVLELAHVPGVIGGTLEGVITTRNRIHLREDQGIHLHLTCILTTTRWGPLRKRAEDLNTQMGTRIRTDLVWENDRVVNPPELDQSGLETRIPVRMRIPASCRETTEREEVPAGHDVVSWFLEARAEPGHRWRAKFEVPIFRTADSPPPEEPELQGDLRPFSMKDMVRAATNFNRKRVTEVAEPAQRPASSRVTVHPRQAEGVRIDYPVTAQFFAHVVAWLSTLTLYAIPLSRYPSVPLGPLASLATALGEMLGPAGSWALAVVVNGLAGLTLYYYPRRLLVGPQKITLYCGPPLVGARRHLATAEAEGVVPDPKNFAISRKGRTDTFTRTFLVGPPTLKHAEARWLAAEIERALAAYR